MISMNPEKSKTDCVFCKIASGEIHSDVLYRDDEVVAFKDIKPVAPVHVQIIPMKHIPTVADIQDADTGLLGKMVSVANKIAKEQGLSSYRLIINCGVEAGMEIYHLHLHLMGGRQLRWNN